MTQKILGMNPKGKETYHGTTPGIDRRGILKSIKEERDFSIRPVRFQNSVKLKYILLLTIRVNLFILSLLERILIITKSGI